MPQPFAAVILAAGQGTRMRSPLPKVLHEAAGQPLLEHVLQAVAPLEPKHTVVVVGHGAEAVKARFAERGVSFALQAEQLGTGHAVMQAAAMLEGFSGSVMVLYGDDPLLETSVLQALLETHQQANAGMSLLSYDLAEPGKLGRILRNADGSLRGIIEAKDASDAEQAINEVNAGVYVFDSMLFTLCQQLGNRNAAGEYYLTDILALYQQAQRPVQAVRNAQQLDFIGVNDREQLARVDSILRARLAAPPPERN